jgi:hypothetical protein
MLFPTVTTQAPGWNMEQEAKKGFTRRGGLFRKHSEDAPLSRGTARSEKGPLRYVKEQDNRALPSYQCKPLRTSADPARRYTHA